jgi:two-component system OmpR family sensor kinase
VGIVMFSSEKRSLLRFLAIYLSSTLTLFVLAIFIFYSFQKHQIIDSQNSELKIKSEQIVQELRELMHNYEHKLVYPHYSSYDSAIYNLDKAYIFGTHKYQNIEWDKEYYQQGNKLFYINHVQPYYLGAAYLIVSKNISEEPLDKLFTISLFFLLSAIVIFTLLGLFLGKLFIAPMKDSMRIMNKFIEDTTHELNTPISTILTNIELLESIYNCSGKQEMKRIEIASKTLSRLYEDLTYLKLNHDYHRDIELLNISQLLQERIEFFKTLIEAKDISLSKNIKLNIFLEMDRNDAIRLMDNLLSNAIKYNKKFGELNITLRNNELWIQNSGLGIKADKIELIHTRFKRANSSEGGFGIGLDIIGQVVSQYNFNFEISSTYNEYTEVKISW